jgi:Sodium/calcium exchanger protein
VLPNGWLCCLQERQMWLSCRNLRFCVQGLLAGGNLAGATLMAAGSSAPVIFFAFFALVIPSSQVPSSVGLDTVVGAAMCNVLVVIGCSALSARQPLQLDGLPVLRDALFYAASIGTLAGVVADGKASWCVSSNSLRESPTSVNICATCCKHLSTLSCTACSEKKPCSACLRQSCTLAKVTCSWYHV